MNKTIKILLAADAFMLLATGLFGPLYAVFVVGIGGDLMTAGTAFAVFAFTSGIFVLAASRAEDHMRKPEIMIPLGYFLHAVGIFGYLFVKTPMHLFIVQMIIGLGEGIEAPAWDGFYSKFLDVGQYTTEWGYELGQTKIFTALAAGIGGYIAAAYSFKILFAMMFLFAVASFITSLQLIRTSKSSGKHAPHRT